MLIQWWEMSCCHKICQYRFTGGLLAAHCCSCVAMRAWCRVMINYWCSVAVCLRKMSQVILWLCCVVMLFNISDAYNIRVGFSPRLGAYVTGANDCALRSVFGLESWELYLVTRSMELHVACQIHVGGSVWWQKYVVQMVRDMCDSLHFNGHVPDEPGLAGVYWSKVLWKWWWQLEL